jgi:hypothetical protein
VASTSRSTVGVVGPAPDPASRPADADAGSRVSGPSGAGDTGAMNTRRALVLAWLSVGVGAAPAAAQQQCVAPPGTAAVEQYCETIPAATGPRTLGPSHTAAPPSAPTPVPVVQRRLARAGAPGQELDRLVQRSATAPPVREHHARASRPRAAATPAPLQIGSPLRTASAVLSGGETVGGGFGWVLLAIAAATGGAGWLRLRRR